MIPRHVLIKVRHLEGNNNRTSNQTREPEESEE